MILAFLQIFIKIGRKTNVLEWFWHKGSLIWPWIPFKVILNFIKNLCLYNVDIFEKFYKDWAFNKRYITEKDDFQSLRMTFEAILHLMKNLRLYIVSIHRIFHQHQFINECSRKKWAKITESRRPGVFYLDIKELTFLITSRPFLYKNLHEFSPFLRIK